MSEGAVDTRAARLAALRAEREQIASERQAEESERELDDELERAEQAVADERALRDAVREHGPMGKRIAALKTPGIGVVIVKRPNPVAFRKWSDENTGREGAIPSDALAQLVRPCVVHPSLVDFDRYCDEQPALVHKLSLLVTKLAGLRGAELSGKYTS